MRSLGIVLIVVLVLVAGSGCRALLRYPVEVPDPQRDVDAIIQQNANPRLLTGRFGNRLRIEIDWVEGCAPTQKAIRGLEKRLDRYLAEEMRAEIVVDDEIPRAEWDAIDRYDTHPLVEKYLDQLPDDESEVVYVLYQPHHRGYFGHTDSWMIERDGRLALVDGLAMFQDSIRRRSILWISAATIERTTLIHEFGHVLGLTNNPEHVQFGNPMHCSNPQCVMTHPRWRSVAYNFPRGFFTGTLPSNYCRACRADLERGRKLWEEVDPSMFEARRQARQLNAEAQHRWKQDEREQALALVGRAIELDPEHARYRHALAWFHERQGDKQAALHAYQDAMRLDPMPWYRLQVVTLMGQTGRFEELLELLDEPTLRLARKSAHGQYGMTAYRVRSRALRRTGRAEEAAELWGEYLSHKKLRNTERNYATLALVAVLRSLNRPEQAEQAIHRLPKKWLKTWPYTDWRFTNARLALDQGDRSRAEELLHAVIATAESEWNSRGEDERLHQVWYWPNALALLGKESDARRVLEQVGALEQFAGPAGAHLRARTLALLGDVDGSLGALEDETAIGYGGFDPCLDLDLEVVRQDPRFHEQFPECGS